MFPWVNGFAIRQGLVPPAQAKDILQVLLAKLETIGFHSYPLGLPTNLTPMSPADYIPNTSGAPRRADGTDTWQIYMNGGATPALEYYFIQALYRTDQYESAERLLWPLMGSYERGTFNAGIQLRTSSSAIRSAAPFISGMDHMVPAKDICPRIGMASRRCSPAILALASTNTVIILNPGHR